MSYIHHLDRSPRNNEIANLEVRALPPDPSPEPDIEQVRRMRPARVDIQISNSGSGFFGITGLTRAGRAWVNQNVQGAHRGEAWSDDRGFTMDIAQGAMDAGLEVR